MTFRAFPRLLASLFLAAAFLLPGHAASAATTTYTATSRDGVRLAVEESGNPGGPTIIFVHGLLGSRLNWGAQVQSAELSGYRIITYDLRGHGQSGKPAGAEPYHDGQRWADDLDAVIKASHARRPVVVGWSLGGVVISNYLATYGDADISGAVYVDGVVEINAAQIVAHPEVYRDMNATDFKTHIDGQRTFIGLCFNQRPDADTLGRLLAIGALASWDMQKEIPSMTNFAAKGIASAKVPMLFLYGGHDALVDTPNTLARALELNPGIETRVYADSGHAPFIEEPARFNRDLADFVRTTSKK